MAVDPSTRPWIPRAESFGARLALVRQAMSWNIKEAALACGLPPENWRNYEQRGRAPRDLAATVRKIAQRTGCDPIWLAFGPDPRAELSKKFDPAREQGNARRVVPAA